MQQANGTNRVEGRGRGRWPRFAVTEAVEARAFMARHGWVIFRDVFSEQEIEHLREKANEPAQLAHQGDILSNPVIAGDDFILHQRVLKAAAALVQDRPCYFGDSTVSVDGNILGFHKDNAYRRDPSAPDWGSDYNLIRVGLYLQDHERYSGGLSVRDASHKVADYSTGRPISVPSRAGDLVVWRLTTTHSGEAVRLRMFGSVFVPIPIVRAVMRLQPIARTIFRPRQRKERIALFATFAGAGDHLQRYLEYLKTRSYAVECWQHSNYPQARAALCAAAGVHLIDVRDEVAALDAGALHHDYVAPQG
jgi:predicted 2-oxoglutarate/Fe(II)-dependent dioxygenase YbiX